VEPIISADIYEVDLYGWLSHKTLSQYHLSVYLKTPQYLAKLPGLWKYLLESRTVAVKNVADRAENQRVCACGAANA